MTFFCSAPMDTNLLSNIHKLFSERIDIFSPVEFNKVGANKNRFLVNHTPKKSGFSLYLSVVFSYHGYCTFLTLKKC